MISRAWPRTLSGSAAAALAVLTFDCSGDERGISRNRPDVGSGGSMAAGSGGSQASARGGSAGTTDASSPPPPDFFFPNPISASSCHLERFTAATIATIVGAPVRFTKLGTNQNSTGARTTLVFGEAPSIGRTFVVSAELTRDSTSTTITLDPGSTDTRSDAGADAGTGVVFPAPIPSAALAPDSGTPACESPPLCDGVPSDDPICRWNGASGSGVTESGRLIFSRTASGGGPKCELETEPLGFPIDYGTFRCGVATNAVVLTASALYATCFCAVD